MSYVYMHSTRKLHTLLSNIDLGNGQSKMELELGLALPNSHLMLGFDLNCSEYSKKTTSGNFCSRKRGFEDAFPEAAPPLSLLFVSKDDGAGGDGGKRQLGSSGTYNIGGSKVLIGWPPVKLPWRMSCGGGGGGGGAQETIDDGEDEVEGGAAGRANCVKVKMEGVAIGRKVDLSLHDSYEALFHTLNQMFPNKLLDGKVSYDHKHTVTYEDGDGDWLLVGDVPWEAFIQSVKRLKILH